MLQGECDKGLYRFDLDLRYAFQVCDSCSVQKDGYKEVLTCELQVKTSMNMPLCYVNIVDIDFVQTLRKFAKSYDVLL